MERELIEAAVDALGIQAVYLRESSVRCKQDFLPPFLDSSVSLTPQYRVGPTGRYDIVEAAPEGEDDSGRTVVFYFEGGVRLVDGDGQGGESSARDIPEEQVLLEIIAEFCAQYRLDANANEEALQPALVEFGRFNVGYHVWPYWREYVQGTCARIGIPPIPIPMYQVSKESADDGA